MRFWVQDAKDQANEDFHQMRQRFCIEGHIHGWDMVSQYKTKQFSTLDGFRKSKAQVTKQSNFNVQIQTSTPQTNNEVHPKTGAPLPKVSKLRVDL